MDGPDQGLGLRLRLYSHFRPDTGNLTETETLF